MALSRTFACNPAEMDKILDEVRKLGAIVDGDPAGGTLTGQTPLGAFEGSYAHDGQQVTLTITKKPALVPDGFLESRLDEMARKYQAT